MNKKQLIISIICILVSITSGILTKDILIGSTILATGLLCAYFANEGKRINYIFGLINYLLMGYVAFKNHLYGIFIFYLFIFSPLQMHGFITWNKNLDENKDVKVREFTLKNGVFITCSCIILSILLGYLLTLIPNQKLAFMDASSNCINLCGVILMILRFKECFWIYLVNNIIDVMIWFIIFIHKGEGSVNLLLVSIGFLLLNIYGIIKWNIKAKKKNIN